MSVRSILNEDWSDYDDRKLKRTDAQNFSCTERWEVEYLTSKIQKNYPKLTREDIRNAIQACCGALGSPHPRQAFVECVARRLEIPNI